MKFVIVQKKISQHPQWGSAHVLSLFLGCIILSSCAGALNPSGLRINTDYLPEGSLRLAEVVMLGTRAEIVENKTIYEVILLSGVSDSDIKDGSVALARIYCCGGPNEKDTARMLFIPPTVNVEAGDIVEVRSGRSPDKGDSGRLNTVTQVRQKRGDSSTSCRWIPPNPRLWARVLYCDWMPADGWVEQRGLFNTWYRPVSKEP